MPDTSRLDVALVARGLARSRTRARALIEAGEVAVGGVVASKTSLRVGPDEDLEVRSDRDRWVGRAAGKLVGALTDFDIPVSGRRCIDIGACTGGFTQVLLEHGAAHVIALDVGHDQLAPEIAADPRVSERSGTTIRGLTPEDIGGAVELAVGDLSFISLRLVLAEIHALLTPQGDAVLLIKPQFEVGRHGLGRKGVVTDPAARRAAIEAVLASAGEVGFAVLGVTHSPVRGGEGNHEYLVHLTRRTREGLAWQAQQVIAHELTQEEGR
ncbi:hemolysin A [Janibacter sp. Soil728]|uniref:TlyA family RNA methyltransferase n=1 Tax=Janibacter sp. Soil728 TaxID=1736393 RepID=UPI00070103B8|nr:TlyA family RNA methyltransferase [Janibacter sp. Soil728]KRE37241.1 hemolysin A [Janibacter sp. Soil728]